MSLPGITVSTDQQTSAAERSHNSYMGVSLARRCNKTSSGGRLAALGYAAAQQSVRQDKHRYKPKSF